MEKNRSLVSNDAVHHNLYEECQRVTHSPVYTVQFAYIVQDSADECSQDLHHKRNTRCQMAVLSKLQITEEQATLNDTVVALQLVSERTGRGVEERHVKHT